MVSSHLHGLGGVPGILGMEQLPGDAGRRFQRVGRPQLALQHARVWAAPEVLGLVEVL